jgi:ribonucleotide monophosphatase NagD (HAD superfamily)
MKAFALWAALLVAVYAGLSAGSHLTRSAAVEKILVAVDVSGSLEEAKMRLPQALDFLRGRRYARFKIVTNGPNKSLRVVQDWSPDLDLSAVERIAMYTTLPLKALLEDPDVKTADLVVFVTNAPDTGALSGVPRSRIVRVR